MAENIIADVQLGPQMNKGCTTPVIFHRVLMSNERFFVGLSYCVFPVIDQRVFEG